MQQQWKNQVKFLRRCRLLVLNHHRPLVVEWQKTNKPRCKIMLNIEMHFVSSKQKSKQLWAICYELLFAFSSQKLTSVFVKRWRDLEKKRGKNPAAVRKWFLFLIFYQKWVLNLMSSTLLHTLHSRLLVKSFTGHRKSHIYWCCCRPNRDQQRSKIT